MNQSCGAEMLKSTYIVAFYGPKSSLLFTVSLQHLCVGFFCKFFLPPIKDPLQLQVWREGFVFALDAFDPFVDTCADGV